MGNQQPCSPRRRLGAPRPQPLRAAQPLGTQRRKAGTCTCTYMRTAAWRSLPATALLPNALTSLSASPLATQPYSPSSRVVTARRHTHAERKPARVGVVPILAVVISGHNTSLSLVTALCHTDTCRAQAGPCRCCSNTRDARATLVRAPSRHCARRHRPQAPVRVLQPRSQTGASLFRALRRDLLHRSLVDA